MKTLALSLALFVSAQTFAEMVNRKCYDAFDYDNETSIYLTFDTVNKIIVNLSYETKSDYKLFDECISQDYQTEGEVLDYGQGKLSASCDRGGIKTQINYINDYDEWLFYIKTDRSDINSDSEWTCE